MTPHDKKRVLEQDVSALTAEFLEVREEQLNVEDEKKWKELEDRAINLLDTIGRKNHDIASLFPQAPPPCLDSKISRLLRPQLAN